MIVDHFDLTGLVRDIVTCRDVSCMVTGESMSPLLRHGDTVTFSYARPRLGDIVVYSRDGRFFVHRAVWTLGPRIITRGDNWRVLDPPVEPADILGTVHTVIRNGTNTGLGSRNAARRAVLSLISGAAYTALRYVYRRLLPQRRSQCHSGSRISTDSRRLCA